MNTAVLSLKERFALSRFLRGEKPVSENVTLNHRRIFILPSQRGLGFVGMIVLLLTIAFIYNNNLAYLLAFLLASIFFVSILHSYKALVGLTVTPGHAHPVFAGEMAGFDFHIHNQASHPRYNLKLRLHASIVINLDAQSKKTLTLYKPTQKRGILACETLTLSSTFPLGLFRAWSPLRFSQEVIVYPKPGTVELPFPETDGIPGEQGQGKQGGDDFYGLQSYQQGDSIRKIHWKTYAKGQGLFSKQYMGTAATDLWLDYANTPGHDSEQRLSQLCRWLIDAEKAGLAYGLLLPGQKIACNHGRKHFHHCLQALALF